MNRTLTTIAVTLAVFGFSACTPAEVKHFLTATRKPAPTVVNHQPTVVDAPFLSDTATVTFDIGTPAFPVIPNEWPPVAVSAPTLLPYNCENGAENGACNPTPVSDPDAPAPPEIDNI